MAKRYSDFDKEKNWLTAEEKATVAAGLKGKNNTFEGAMKAYADAERNKVLSAWQADIEDRRQATFQNLGQLAVENRGGTYDGEISPANREYALALSELILEMQEAGMDPYSDPEVRYYVQLAGQKQWLLPTQAGVDYDRFARDYQDQQYIKGLQDGPNGTYQGWNFGYDPNNLPAGVDAETAARMAAMLPQPAQPEQPHGPDNRRDIAEGWHYDSAGNWVSPAGGNPYEHKMTNTAYTQDESGNWVPNANYEFTFEPGRSFRQAQEGNAVTPEQIAAAARNGTPGWLSDEYEDINTRVSGEGGAGVGNTGSLQLNEDAISRLTSAMAASGAYTDQGKRFANMLAQYNAAKSPQYYSSGDNYAGGAPSAGTNPALSASQKQEAYRNMLDALVRGSNGGRTTSTGLSAANSIYDSMRAAGANANGAYRQYANYGGNRLTRDKDYDYLNRLLGVKK